jgi:radical SAM protein with 4Fe4S-binding SPASM domain
MQSPKGRYGELPFESMVRLIEQFDRANVIEVSLTGGEPFLRKDLLDIMATLARRRIRVSQIYSNGLLITAQILEKIRGIGLSPIFQISLDGYGSHEYMRGREGIEQAVIAAIRRVRAAGFRVIIATSVDRVNIGRLRDTYDLLRGLDIQSWRISAPEEAGNWRGTRTDLSFDEQADAYAMVLDWWLRDGRPFAIVLGGFFVDSRRDAPAGAEEQKRLYAPESYDCGACRERLNLLPDGTLLPCAGYVDTVLEGGMPNILTDSLSHVWIDSLVRRIADIKKRDLLARNEECGRCELFGNCGAGCRAAAVRLTGDLTAKDPLTCELWTRGYKQRFFELAGGIPGPERR